MEAGESVQEEHNLLDSESRDYSKYGIDQPKNTMSTAIGKTKTCDRISPKEWIFLIASTLNILIAIGFSCIRLTYIDSKKESLDFTVTILLLLNLLFCLFYIYHGVFRERVYELIAFVAAIFCCGCYFVLDYFIRNNNDHIISMITKVCYIVFFVLACINILLVILVVRQFGYLEFNIVGANQRMQGLYRQASLFSCLLKFDLQIACSLAVFVLQEGTDLSNLEIFSLSIGVLFSCLWTFFGWIVLRKELTWGSYIFAVVGLVKPTYYLYKLVTEYMKTSYSDETVLTSNTDMIFYAFMVIVAIGLIVWLILMVELVFVTRNFGMGLKELNGESSQLLTADRSQPRYGADDNQIDEDHFINNNVDIY